jgi:excisionase family DNA binding protein
MLVTIPEVAKELKVSDRHVRRMIAEGKFPFYRIGDRAVRLDLEEIKSTSRKLNIKSSDPGGGDPAGV